MCDTLVSLTDDGVLFAKNSDRDPNESQVLRWFPATEHPAGDRLQATWITIDQVPDTNAVVLSQPWWLWGAEMGANEFGLTIGNEAVFTTEKGEAEPGLLGMDLLRLALERAATRHDAVQVIVGLLERHGQGGSCSKAHPSFTYDNSYLIADGDGAVVLETAGRRWATEEVAGAGRSISNGLSIAGFAEAHAQRIRPAVAACALRRARTQPLAEAAGGVADLFAALRDHGPTPSPTWSKVNGALTGPCAHAGGLATATQTTASWVADLRGDPLHWATATAAPCTSVFKPVLVDRPAPRPGDDRATDRFDPEVGWWRHEQLHRLAMHDHAGTTARFAAERDQLEARWLADPPATDQAFDEAERVEATWLADLRAAGLPDRRPRWLRGLQGRWDRQAALSDEPTRPTSGAPA